MATALYNIFIMPIQLFIELVFSVMNTVFNNPGFAIIFVSVAVQLLCFPLYKRADDIQTEDREKQKEMKPWLDHIKKTFKGDERFMMQQNYYRICNYKPIYAVKGSISLLLQIPFFIAAYNFLSNLELLKKVSFLGIADLSQPDQLIHIGGITLNLLPVLMTFFNVISGIIYLRGLPLKDKIQTYGLAALFLVILYKSPSGLVFYWTLNNLFSLLKNVFLKLVKNPRKIIRVFMLALGIIVPVYVVFFSGRAIYLKLASIAFSLVCLMPTVVHFIKKKSGMKASLLKNIDVKLSNTVFYLSLTVIFILCALVIPAYAIKASPIEFISVSYGPIGLLFRVMCIFAGLLFVWVNIFYVFASEKAKKIFSLVISAATVVFAVDYFFFARKLGLISPYLIYDKYPVFSLKQIAVNILIILLITLTMFFAHIKKAVIVKRL
ncbi:MAG: membrane protein insertase YidC, partial [Ruminococcus sp.]|nr:membrane protein insertase YidC [Candidatus Copronaster equi]